MYELILFDDFWHLLPLIIYLLLIFHITVYSRHTDRSYVFHVWGLKSNWTLSFCLETLCLCVFISNIIVVPEHTEPCPIQSVLPHCSERKPIQFPLHFYCPLQIWTSQSARWAQPVHYVIILLPLQQRLLFFFFPEVSWVHLQNPRASLSGDPKGKRWAE